MCDTRCDDVYTVQWTRSGGWRYPTE
jgi:hypothetical protein